MIQALAGKGVDEPYMFTEAVKYKFPAKGSSSTQPHCMGDFVFKDFCPKVFSKLRKTFGIDEQEYLYSLCGDFNLLEFQSNSKSNQFFFFSHDGQFLIKTMSYQESLFLRNILPHYFQHCQQQPNTFLCKFLGMHRVKPRGKSTVYFLIMENVTYSDLKVHLAYDLKGCTYGRKTESVDDDDSLPVLKDCNWLEDKKALDLGKHKTRLFMNQLKKDVAFLKNQNIMDYSLLIGIHFLDKFRSGKFEVRAVSRSIAGSQTLPAAQASDAPEGRGRRISVVPSDSGFHAENLVATNMARSRSLSGRISEHPFKGCHGGFQGEDRSEIYFVGIIDILQQYNSKKTAENFFKGMMTDKRQISSVPPPEYGDRFYKFMRNSMI